MSIWDTFAHTPGAIADGGTGDPADDHYHRFLDDVQIMTGLGVNAYRFSVAWPRIQPEATGPANPQGVAFYRQLAQALLERDITPYATLYHWDLPQALEDAGGWLNRETADRFVDYTKIVVEELGDLVKHWITLNEPWCSSFLSYAGGEHAPGKTLGARAARAGHHLLLAHGRAVPAIRALQPEATVCVTLNLYSIRPASESAADQDAARRIDGLTNRFFLDPVLLGRYPADVLHDLGEETWFQQNPTSDLAEINADIDYLGINYYSRYTPAAGVAPDRPTPYPGSDFVEMTDTGAPRTKMGWEIHPDGLVDVLRMANTLRPGLPLFVTENGAAYDDTVNADGQIVDEDRRAYIEEHMGACAEALRAGLPLKGYFVWTLMDNFEWAWGYTRRFGVVYVDFATQRRTMKHSGYWLANFLGGTAAQKQAEAPV
jgi:beta-glucosidase